MIKLDKPIRLNRGKLESDEGFAQALERAKAEYADKAKSEQKS